MEIQKDIINKECKEFWEQEHVKIETIDKLPLKNETDNFIFKEKVKVELEEDGKKLKELDVFDGLPFIKTEEDESPSLCEYKISYNKGGYLTKLLDPKVEPPLYNAADSTMPVNFDEEKKYSNLRPSNCEFFSSNNLNSSVKELQKYPAENIEGCFESDELLTDSKIEILKHSLKTETQDFNTFEDNNERGDWNKIGKVNESNCNDKHDSNKYGTIYLDPEDKKMEEKLETNKGENIYQIFKCNNCDYKTPSKRNFKMHILRHTSPNDFCCPICNVEYKKKQNLDYHIVLKHSDNEQAMSIVTYTVHSCTICAYKTMCISHLKTHLQKHKDREANKFQCHKCHYKTIHEYNLKSHIQTHADPKSIPCQVCNKKFYAKKDLDCHICAKHSNNEKAMLSLTRKIYSCEICQYKTVFKRRIKAHIIGKHKGEDAEKNIRKYSCSMCNYKTYSHTNFLKHQEAHKEEKQYQRDVHENKPEEPQLKRKLACEICNTCFFSKQQLDGHILTSHSENEEIMSSITSEYYSCDICDFKTVWLENIKSHQQSHLDNIKHDISN